MIKFVRKYRPYSVDEYDVLYESGRLQHYIGKCPKTVIDFIQTANKQTEQVDWLNGLEIIYEMKEVYTMTYYELLEMTEQKKQKAINELNTALNGPGGWLVKAEIQRDPGSVAWCYLAKWFCETLAEHVSEFLEQVGDIDSTDAREIADIYMAYEDSSPDLYDLLPVEAQLFS